MKRTHTRRKTQKQSRKYTRRRTRKRSLKTRRKTQKRSLKNRKGGGIFEPSKECTQICKKNILHKNKCLIDCNIKEIRTKSSIRTKQPTVNKSKFLIEGF